MPFISIKNAFLNSKLIYFMTHTRFKNTIKRFLTGMVHDISTAIVIKLFESKRLRVSR